MRRLTSILLASICAFALVQSPASAQEAPYWHETDNCESHSATAGSVENFGRKATDVEKEFLRTGLGNGSIPHIAADDNIDLDQTVTVQNLEKSVYRIPLSRAKSDVDYILVQTSGNTIERVAETHIEQINSDEAHLQVWINGKSEFDNVVRESDSAFQARGVSDAWHTFNSCLSNAGVPMAIVTAISIACGLLGAFTAGAGVPACMIGAAGGFAGTVSFCYGRALKAL